MSGHYPELTSRLCAMLGYRWKRNTKNEIVKDPVTQKPILQFVAIVRRDHGDWAIPGVSIFRVISRVCSG